MQQASIVYAGVVTGKQTITTHSGNARKYTGSGTIYGKLLKKIFELQPPMTCLVFYLDDIPKELAMRNLLKI